MEHEHIDGEVIGACPLCGAYGGRTLAQPPALLAVCDVLVVWALERVGRRIVRADRSRYQRFNHRPWHLAHTLWLPDPLMVDRGLAGCWDVIPAMLTNHGCCGVTSVQVQQMIDSYVRDLLVTGTAHNMDDLRYRFEAFLGIPIPEVEPYDPAQTGRVTVTT